MSKQPNNNNPTPSDEQGTFEEVLTQSLEWLEQREDETLTEFNKRRKQAILTAHQAAVEAAEEKANMVDHTIDVRNEPDVIKAFNLFIQKWCGRSYPHLIDSDENDGEFMRDKIQQAVKAAEVVLLEKLKAKCRDIDEFGTIGLHQKDIDAELRSRTDG